jgi:hypothetical protein
MSLLRSLLNLAVLVILTVAVLSMSSRPMAAQSSCHPVGTRCTSNRQCCNNWCYGGFCCWGLPHHSCTNWLQCCSRTCVGGRCNYSGSGADCADAVIEEAVCKPSLNRFLVYDTDGCPPVRR